MRNLLLIIVFLLLSIVASLFFLQVDYLAALLHDLSIYSEQYCIIYECCICASEQVFSRDQPNSQFHGRDIFREIGLLP